MSIRRLPTRDLACPLATILAVAPAALAQQPIDDEVERFEISGGGLQLPEYDCRRLPGFDGDEWDGIRPGRCTVAAGDRNRYHHWLPEARVTYTDAQGRGHQGLLHVLLVHSRFDARISYLVGVFGGLTVTDASGSGAAEAVWAMTFPDGSGLDGTFTTADIGLSRGEKRGEIVLRLPFRVSLRLARGPLFGSLVGDCHEAAACTFTSVQRATPRSLRELTFPAGRTRVAVARRSAAGRLRLRTRRGRPRVRFSLPPGRPLTDRRRHRLMAVALPRSACRATLRQADGAQATIRADAGRLGFVDLGPERSWGLNRTRGPARYRVALTCSRDGVAQPAAARRLRVLDR